MDTSVTPRPAATIILLRDSDAGPEVWLMERARALGFMGAAWVFPGGRVDAEDEHVPVVGGDFGVVPRSFWAAAARELEEEAGVRLAAAGGPYELDRMALWSHWITPPVESRRYDTWFFVARMPAGQEAGFDGREAVNGRWLRPDDAVARALGHALPLAPPTLRSLAELSGFPDVEAILSARRRFPPICPSFEHVGDEVWVLLPGDPAFPAPEADAVDPPTRFLFPLRGWQAR